MSTSTGRAAAIYHCPFCGEEDLRPHEGSAGAWSCSACARVFTVGLVTVDTSIVPGHQQGAHHHQGSLR